MEGWKILEYWICIEKSILNGDKKLERRTEGIKGIDVIFI